MFEAHNGWTAYTIGLASLAILGMAALSFGVVLAIDWINERRRKKNEPIV